ncbi:unnamed protein product [Rhizophagus irregularis]|nr:unnamed protein product [Rhizophagus irregularis]
MKEQVKNWRKNYIVKSVSLKVSTLLLMKQVRLIIFFSCDLATILARDNEVVTVRLVALKNACKIYICKNFAWLEDDVKEISKNAPMISDDAEVAFYQEVGILKALMKLP